MIRTNEAVLLLNTSPPTFYKRVKKTEIQLITKQSEKGKASYIDNNDLERLAKEMGKVLPIQKDDKEENIPKEPNKDVIKDNELLKENFQLQIQNKTLEGKLEEYSGYVDIYKKQSDDSNKKIIELETNRMNLLTEVLKAKVSL